MLGNTVGFCSKRNGNLAPANEKNFLQRFYEEVGLLCVRMSGVAKISEFENFVTGGNFFNFDKISKFENISLRTEIA